MPCRSSLKSAASAPVLPYRVGGEFDQFRRFATEQPPAATGPHPHESVAPAGNVPPSGSTGPPGGIEIGTRRPAVRGRLLRRVGLVGHLNAESFGHAVERAPVDPQCLNGARTIPDHRPEHVHQISPCAARPRPAGGPGRGIGSAEPASARRRLDAARFAGRRYRGAGRSRGRGQAMSARDRGLVPSPEEPSVYVPPGRIAGLRRRFGQTSCVLHSSGID
jgi:hypothetical protein